MKKLILLAAILLSVVACKNDKNDKPEVTPPTTEAPVVTIPTQPPGEVVVGPTPPAEHKCSKQETIYLIGGGSDFSPSRIGSPCFDGKLNNGQPIPEPYYFCYCPDKGGTWKMGEADFGPCKAQPRGPCHKGMTWSGHEKFADGGCYIWKCE